MSAYEVKFNQDMALLYEIREILNRVEPVHREINVLMTRTPVPPRRLRYLMDK